MGSIRQARRVPMTPDNATRPRTPLGPGCGDPLFAPDPQDNRRIYQEELHPLFANNRSRRLRMRWRRTIFCFRNRPNRALSPFRCDMRLASKGQCLKQVVRYAWVIARLQAGTRPASPCGRSSAFPHGRGTHNSLRQNHLSATTLSRPFSLFMKVLADFRRDLAIRHLVGRFNGDGVDRKSVV